MEAVDLALIVALDGSASVTFDEFNLMANGCATALRDAEVVDGLTGGPLGASLGALLLWSGEGAQEVMVDWTRLDSPEAVEAFAQAVADVPRVVHAGATAIGEALAACARLLQQAPAASRRQVIDMVGDGRSNEGIRPEPVRDRLADAGVTVNGLCVLHEEADLLASYTAEVIGGPGAFAVQCRDFAGFAGAMRQKLTREIAQARRGRDAAVQTSRTV
jgi:Ca-activated chloride channel family protein